MGKTGWRNAPNIEEGEWWWYKRELAYLRVTATKKDRGYVRCKVLFLNTVWDDEQPEIVFINGIPVEHSRTITVEDGRERYPMNCWHIAEVGPQPEWPPEE